MDGNSLRGVGGDSDSDGTESPLDVSPTGDNDKLPVTVTDYGDLFDNQQKNPEAVILNRDGTPRKKPGRKPGQKNGETAPVTGVEAVSLSPDTPKTPQSKKAVRLGCDQTARAVLGTTVGALREFIGPEWDFTSQDEADGMRIALAAYIESKGGGEMSPEFALLLLSCGYAAPRFSHENTRTKVGNFFASCLNAIKGIFTR